MELGKTLINAARSEAQEPRESVVILHEQKSVWIGRFRLLGRFASVQLLIQVLSFGSGILIIRALPKEDYAWFTIVNSLCAMIAVLGDCGASAALSALGGTIWQDAVRFGSLIRTALTLRKWLALWSGLIVVPILIWTLVKSQAPATTIVVLVVLTGLTASMQLNSSVLNVVISLRQELRKVEFLGFSTALARAILLALILAVFPNVEAAIFVGACALTLQLWLLLRWVRASIVWNSPPSAEYRCKIVATIKKQAPTTIFYSIQGQLNIWLITMFGSSEAVAEVGALGRFVVAFALLHSIANGVVVPRFARCQDREVLRCRYWQVASGFVITAGLLVMFSALVPQPFIWLLGEAYGNLEKEVWLMMLNAGLWTAFGFLNALALAKAWIVPSAICIPLELASQVLLILSFDISTVRGVLLVSCLASIVPIASRIAVARYEMTRSSANG